MPPRSYAYFCPHCGDVWARAVIDGTQFQIWSITCDRHQPPYASMIPGSLWLPWDSALNDSLPDEAVRREMRLHLEHASKQEIEE